ncbi:MAG TPA: leucine-rich repeat domain-containing protein [Candidatus Deferrimicrobium sp.]|nr:leucine-rich repeat domain-containing protein [Candidatus Deferrimicrobium sp.]
MRSGRGGCLRLEGTVYQKDEEVEYAQKHGISIPDTMYLRLTETGAITEVEGRAAYEWLREVGSLGRGPVWYHRHDFDLLPKVVTWDYTFKGKPKNNPEMSSDYVTVQGEKIYINKEGILDLSRLGIVEIAEIQGLDRVHPRGIFLFGNQLTDISPLGQISSLKGLHSLVADRNFLTEVPRLPELSSLHWLSLGQNQIPDIEGVHDLPQLTVLSLAKNRIKEYESIGHLTNLGDLYLSRNQITRIQGLERLTNLERLDLSLNQLTKIEGLDNLEKLGILRLSYNQISRLEGLDALKNLEILDLRHNQISCLEGIQALNSLRILYLSYNSIEEVDGGRLPILNAPTAGVNCAIHIEGNRIKRQMKIPPEYSLYY